MNIESSVIFCFDLKKNISKKNAKKKKENKKKLTRPDTWPIPVANGWAGAEMRVFLIFDLCPWTDQWTDRQTNGQMAKPLIELRIRN